MSNPVVDRLKSSVSLLKKEIVRNMRREFKVLKMIKNSQSDSDKEALSEEAKRLHQALKASAQALDDLTYAFVKERPMFSKKIISMFKYKTPEGFLADKEMGNMPELRSIIDIISNYSMYIPEIYQFGYDQTGQRTVVRDYSVIDKLERGKGAELEFATGDIKFDVRNAKSTAAIVANGARHK